jgi:hypothetical protein
MTGARRQSRHFARAPPLSSILKALKKLDKEPAAGIEIGSLATTLDITKIFKKPRKDRWSWRRVYPVLQVLIIGAGVSLLGLYLLHNQARQPDVPGQNIDIAAEEGTIRDTRASGVAVQALSVQEQPVPGSGLQTGTTMAESGRPDTDRPRRQAETNNPASRIENTPTVDVSPAGLPPAEPSLLLPRLDYSILRLQAVTWAVDPQDRFALVDDTILRKGDSIKGFVVDSIQEDHIVVGKGGEEWRVEFRLR